MLPAHLSERTHQTDAELEPWHKTLEIISGLPERSTKMGNYVENLEDGERIKENIGEIQASLP